MSVGCADGMLPCNRIGREGGKGPCSHHRNPLSCGVYEGLLVMDCGGVWQVLQSTD